MRNCATNAELTVWVLALQGRVITNPQAAGLVWPAALSGLPGCVNLSSRKSALNTLLRISGHTKKCYTQCGRFFNHKKMLQTVIIS